MKHFRNSRLSSFSSSTFAVLLCFASATSSRAVSGEVLMVGERFPDLVLPSLADGAALSLDAFRGEKVLLQVFASW